MSTASGARSARGHLGTQDSAATERPRAQDAASLPGSSRVVYVLADYPVLSQTFVRNEIAELRATGVDVAVFTLCDGDPDGRQREWAGPYTVLHRPPFRTCLRDLLWWVRHRPSAIKRLLGLLVALWGSGARTALTQLPSALRTQAEEGRAAAVHSHFGWRASTSCLYAGALLGVPASVTLHANDIYMPAGDLRRKLRQFDHLVTVCSYNVGVIRALTSRVPPLSIVPCGVRVPSGEPAPLAGARILSVGRMVPKKGFGDLVRAMELVWRARPDAELEIIGDGPGRHDLELLVDEVTRPSQIRLLGSRPNDEVLEAMATCSVFVLACKMEASGGSDALPVVIREAMVRERPVVSTAVAGIPETLEGAGWVVTPGSQSELAAAILEALSHGPEVRRRAAEARRRTIQRWTLQHTVQGMRKVFAIDEGDAVT